VAKKRRPESMFLGQIGFEKDMKKIKPVQRKICLLLGHGYTLKEIANIVGKSERTIRRDISKIRATIHKKR